MKKYYLLNIVFVLIMCVAVGLLIQRAKSADSYFEAKRTEQLEDI